MFRSNSSSTQEKERENRVCDHNSCLLACVKAFRNGAVYGGSLRFFHSITIGAFFKYYSFKNFKEFALYVSNQTYHHALYLGLFSLLYKLFFCFLTKITKKKSKYNAFIAGCLAGFLVFGEKTNVKYNIILFLLGRSLMGVSQAFSKKLKMQKMKLFPYLSALCCGIALFIYEDDKSVLTPSLSKSLGYLIKDSDKKMGKWSSTANDFGVYLERTLVI